MSAQMQINRNTNKGRIMHNIQEAKKNVSLLHALFLSLYGNQDLTKRGDVHENTLSKHFSLNSVQIWHHRCFTLITSKKALKLTLENHTTSTIGLKQPLSHIFKYHRLSLKSEQTATALALHENNKTGELTGKCKRTWGLLSFERSGNSHISKAIGCLVCVGAQLLLNSP